MNSFSMVNYLVRSIGTFVKSWHEQETTKRFIFSCVVFATELSKSFIVGSQLSSVMFHCLFSGETVT